MLLEMTVKGLTIDPLTSTPIVILKDAEGKNAVPIWIGLMEASAIATELEKIQLSRPMTHDLMRNILESLDAKVVKIVVNDLRDNTFYALIHIMVRSQEIVIDSRPSDAIALALRTSSPILVDKKVIAKSRKIDLMKKEEGLSEEESKKRWAEILEKLSPDDFGKYKM
jgi:bifunctional DNase/RNase